MALNIIFMVLLLCQVRDVVLNDLKCTYVEGNVTHIGDDDAPEVMYNGSSTVFACKNYCFTLWDQDPATNETSVRSQGCWDTSEPSECDKAECFSTSKPPKTMNTTKFCCCNSDHCNDKFYDAYVPQKDLPTESPKTDEQNSQSFILILIICIALFVGIVAIVAVCMYILWLKKPKKEDLESGGQAEQPLAEYDLDDLKLSNIIGQGRYGTVWKGIVEDEDVAVKIFPPHHRNYFLNEHEMYKAAGNHNNLLKCFGGGERVLNDGGPAEYVLLFSLEQECLQEYLRNNTTDLPVVSRMCVGITRGLAHLHCDLGKAGIAHRDINTRNILVRSDLSCCICDLGLAVLPRGAETTALTEAGTLRYMAPEVLEGAVNLRDCESALRQVDVYALGLVLWELGVRCKDLQSAPPQPYEPPYSREAGPNPTLEQMQAIVSRHKARPMWPPSWKDSPAARLLLETVEDCWDQDAEARLTSLCVVERLQEMSSLKGRILYPHHPQPPSPTPLINNNHFRSNQADASVGTIETLLSPSVDEPCKNSNQFQICAPILQPYQGRNPCMERNLHSSSDSNDRILIDKSMKHASPQSPPDQSLLANDYLGQQHTRFVMPIPYVQNAVHASPKQLNAQVRKSKLKWGLRKLFGAKKRSNSVLETEVKLNNPKLVNKCGVTTSLLGKNESTRPTTLPLSLVKSKDNTLAGVTQVAMSLSRQRSLEQFNEVFSSTSDLSRLKDPTQRVKTPGDVPPSVRRTRGRAAKDSCARFSLYDDRMMCNGQYASAPDLEPVLTNNDEKDRDSVSSF